MIKVSVVILNYNGSDFLKSFIPILIQNTVDAELVVADNASTDDSLAVLKNFPDIKTIQLKKNYGFAGGYNEVLKLIKSEYFLLLNSDVEVTPNWLSPLIAFLDEHKGYAAAQPKLKNYNQRDHFEYAGAAGGFLDSIGYPYCRGRIFETTELDLGQYDDVKNIFWASGATFLIRSDVFHKVGAFDSSFFAHMEEIDLCWRLQSHGYLVACVPESVVYHVGGGTLNKVNPQKTYLNFRNGLRLLVKNLPKKQLFIVLPLRMIFDLVGLLFLCYRESPKHALAVFKGYRDALKLFKKDLECNKRSQISSQVQSNKIIVLDYFLLARKHYNQLNNTR